MKLTIIRFLLIIAFIYPPLEKSFAADNCSDCNVYICVSSNEASKKSYEGASLISISVAAEYAYRNCRKNENSPSSCKTADPSQCKFESRGNIQQKNFDLQK